MKKTYIQLGALVLSIAIFLGGVVMIVPGGVHAANIASETAYCSDFNGNSTLLESSRFDGMVKYIVCLLQESVVPFIFALTIAVFFWGMMKFISTQDASEREQGKQFMLWSVVAIAVMFSVWGLVHIFNQTFGVSDIVPQLPVN